MRLAYFCFISAALAGLAGMSLGIWMGIAHDFTLAPVHAHINLLGWVTLSLYGLYHRSVERRDSRLAWTQVGCGALGFALLIVGMTGLIGAGLDAFLPVAIAGSILCLAGMILFIVILLRDAALAAPKQPAYGW